MHKGDLFWLPWAQNYRTVEQPRVYLLHCCGITSLILSSRETYNEETKAMLPHSPGDFSIDVEQFFSITIAFKSMSYSVFAVAWPDEIVLLSKLRDPLLCSSNFLIWAGYKGISLPLLSFFAGNDLLKSLVKHPSGVLPSPVWCFSFTNLGKSIPLSEPQHYLVAFWTQTQRSLRYTFQLWIHSFIVYSYCLEQPVLSGWVLGSKSVVCVFTTILKFKSVKVFNSVLSKLSHSAQEILPRIHKVL